MKEAAMIELTEQQMQSLQEPGSDPPRVVNPHTKETFVLLRVEEYERLTQDEHDEYDDSPWTREELQALAWERVKQEDWDEYDDLPEKPGNGVTWSSFASRTLPVSAARNGPR